jgi:hypothetical protein
MGQSLDQLLTQVGDGDTVNVTIVSNQDNGIASYAIGGLVFHKATGGVIFGGPPFRPARLESDASQPFQMFFSDRKLDIDPPPEPGTFGHGSRQPFSANATEKLGVWISVGTNAHVMQLEVFGSKSLVVLSAMGDLLVGLGPSFGHSAAGVFVVAFEGITRPPH